MAPLFRQRPKAAPNRRNERKVCQLINLIDQLDAEAPPCTDPLEAGKAVFVPFSELVEMVRDGRCVAVSRGLLREISVALHSEFDAPGD